MNDTNRQLALQLIVEGYRRAGYALDEAMSDIYREAIGRLDPDGAGLGDALAESAVLDVAPWLSPHWEGANLMLDFTDA